MLDPGANKDTQNKPRVERDSSQIREITEEQSEPNKDNLESNIDVYRRATPELAGPPNAVTTGRPQRNRRPPNCYEGNTALKVDYSPVSEILAPTSFTEAICRQDACQ